MGGAIRSVFALGILCVFLMLISIGAGALVSNQRLQSLTDAAALAGAGAIDLGIYSEQGANSAALINTLTAHALIKKVLQRAPQGDVVALEDVSISGADVYVSLSMPLHLELVGTAFGLELRAESHARLVYTAGGS